MHVRHALLAAFVCALSVRVGGAQCADGSAPPCVRIPARSVAVLPFRSDSAQQYFADGVADAIINALAQLGNVKVISRTSSFAFRGREVDLRTIADSLGVAKIVEGSVQKVGDRIRVTANLTDAKSRSTEWSQRFDNTVANVFELEDSVAQAIASRVGGKASTAQRQLAKTNVEANDHYARGRAALYRRDAPSILAAIEAFRQSIRADSRYAPAYAGLSSAYSLYLVLVVWPALSKATSPDSTYGWAARSLAAANRAIALDSSLAEGWAARGYLKLFASTTPDDTERDLRRALEIRPSYSDAYGWLAQLLAFNGRAPEAMEPATRAVELDPMSIGLRMGYSSTAFASREYARAFEQARAVRMTRPELAPAAEWEALALLMLGRSADCLAIPGLPVGLDALCLHAAGRGAEAASRVTALAEDWERGGHATYQMANIIYYFGYSGQVDEFKRWQLLHFERFPLSGTFHFGGLYDALFRQEDVTARVHVEGLRQAAWARVVRESRVVGLP